MKGSTGMLLVNGMEQRAQLGKSRGLLHRPGCPVSKHGMTGGPGEESKYLYLEAIARLVLWIPYNTFGYPKHVSMKLPSC
jgi:hypothetical protein